MESHLNHSSRQGFQVGATRCCVFVFIGLDLFYVLFEGFLWFLHGLEKQYFFRNMCFLAPLGLKKISFLKETLRNSEVDSFQGTPRVLHFLREA